MFRSLLASKSHPQQGQAGHLPTYLLVSVRDAGEAALAQSLGVAWIDLKNPDAGSLGAASVQTAQAVGEVLKMDGDAPMRLSSAAAGELRDDPLANCLMLAKCFPLVKVGLSELAGVRHWETKFRELARQLSLVSAQVVPVIYADYRLCSAPTPRDVLDVSDSLGAADEQPRIKMARHSAVGTPTLLCKSVVDLPSTARYVLIDTYTKDGRRLLDFLSEAELASIIDEAIGKGRRVVLAGSLALSDLPRLLKLPVAAIAVRGAVCVSNRRSGLCPRKVTQWLELVQKR